MIGVNVFSKSSFAFSISSILLIPKHFLPKSLIEAEEQNSIKYMNEGRANLAKIDFEIYMVKSKASKLLEDIKEHIYEIILRYIRNSKECV